MEKQYFQTLQHGIAIRNSNVLVPLLSIRKKNALEIGAVNALSARPEKALIGVCDMNLGEGWGSVVGHHVLASSFVAKKKFDAAFDAQQKAVSAFLRVFKEHTNWCLALLEVLFVELRLIAFKADKAVQGVGSSHHHTKLGDAGRVMRQCLSEDLRDLDNPPHLSRQLGSLFVANQCMKIFFALNSIKHCKALTLPSTPSMEEYRMQDRVTHAFFKGRIALLEERTIEAEEHLGFAFRHCPVDAIKQRRSILMHLVPVRMLLYQTKPSPTRHAAVPTPQLLTKYRLSEYIGLCQAFMIGDIQSFSALLEQHEDFFIKNGVYLSLERCKLFVYRTLFKRAYYASGGNEKVPLAVFRAATVVMGLQMEEDEIECILANLIAKALVRGYIAHTHRIAVLKKEDPFRTHT